MAVSAASNDGASHTVSVYSDISAEWVSGDDSLTVDWSTTTGDLVFHQVQLEQEADFTEISDHIQRGSPSAVIQHGWLNIGNTEGSAYYGTLNVRLCLHTRCN